MGTTTEHQVSNSTDDLDPACVSDPLQLQQHRQSTGEGMAD